MYTFYFPAREVNSGALLSDTGIYAVQRDLDSGAQRMRTDNNRRVR